MDLHFSPQTTLLPRVLLQVPLCQDTGHLGKGLTIGDIVGKPSGEEEESSGIQKNFLKNGLPRELGVYLPGNSHDNRLTLSLMKFEEPSKGK